MQIGCFYVIAKLSPTIVPIFAFHLPTFPPNYSTSEQSKGRVTCEMELEKLRSIMSHQLTFIQ